MFGKELILMNAQSYLKAYHVLSRHQAKESETVKFMVGRPELVCLAFSLELLLKGLLMRYPDHPKLARKKRHDCYELYNALPKNIQDDLYGRWALRHPHIDRSFTFDMWLMKEGRNFEFWRYEHEFPWPGKSATLIFTPYKTLYLIESIEEFIEENRLSDFSSRQVKGAN